MKAAVWYGKKDIRIEEAPDPVVGPGQVKVRIKACGICGSDLHEFNNGPVIIPTRPHPLTGKLGAPAILGHEFSGEVVAVGEGVERFKPGDRVTASSLIYCGECHYCRIGQYSGCSKLGVVGFAWDGAFAEYAVFPEAIAYKLPDTVSDDMGAIVEPLAVAVHAVKRSRMKIGASVAVVGAGPIGLLVMQACRIAGAGQVFVIEPREMRREVAKKTGATAVFDPIETDVGKEISKWTDGLRADWAFDCVGNQGSFDTAVKATARRAVICIIGIATKPIEVPFGRLLTHEKEITFSNGFEDEFQTAIHYLADRRIDAVSLISAKIPLKDLVEKGMVELNEHGDRHLKILVVP